MSSRRGFTMTCPFNQGRICDAKCALLLETDYGLGEPDSYGCLSQGMYLCSLALIAIYLSEDPGLSYSNYELIGGTE